MSSQCVIDVRGQFRITVYQQTNNNQQQENVIANANTFTSTTFTRAYGLQLLSEELLCKMEPNNIKDNYVVCVQKDGVIVGHLMLGRTFRFAKIIFLLFTRTHWLEMWSHHNW